MSEIILSGLPAHQTPSTLALDGILHLVEESKVEWRNIGGAYLPILHSQFDNPLSLAQHLLDSVKLLNLPPTASVGMVYKLSKDGKPGIRLNPEAFRILMQENPEMALAIGTELAWSNGDDGSDSAPANNPLCFISKKASIHNSIQATLQTVFKHGPEKAAEILTNPVWEKEESPWNLCPFVSLLGAYRQVSPTATAKKTIPDPQRPQGVPFIELMVIVGWKLCPLHGTFAPSKADIPYRVVMPGYERVNLPNCESKAVYRPLWSSPMSETEHRWWLDHPQLRNYVKEPTPKVRNHLRQWGIAVLAVTPVNSFQSGKYYDSQMGQPVFVF